MRSVAGRPPLEAQTRSSEDGQDVLEALHAQGCPSGRAALARGGVLGALLERRRHLLRSGADRSPSRLQRCHRLLRHLLAALERLLAGLPGVSFTWSDRSPASRARRAARHEQADASRPERLADREAQRVLLGDADALAGRPGTRSARRARRRSPSRLRPRPPCPRRRPFFSLIESLTRDGTRPCSRSPPRVHPSPSVESTRALAHALGGVALAHPGAGLRYFLSDPNLRSSPIRTATLSDLDGLLGLSSPVSCTLHGP